MDVKVSHTYNMQEVGKWIQENFSRAIEYSIDETIYEVDKVWEYG